MRILLMIVGVWLLMIGALTAQQQQAMQAQRQQRARQQYTAPNSKIDYGGFATNVVEVGKLREERRLSEQDFLEMGQEPDSIIFDARSDSKYAMLHIKGAKHLSLPDITETELAKLIPSKSTRILIYCNNNFENSPKAFPTKAKLASLNVYTFNVLYSYGYTNVYELGPLIDITKSKLTFEGSEKVR